MCSTLKSHRLTRLGFRACRSLALAGVAASALLPTTLGCQRKYAHVATMGTSEPKDADDAMTRREWPQQDAPFANSATHAFKDRFPLGYQNMPVSTRRRTAVLIDPLVFLGQSILLPFTFLRYPPGTKQDYRSLNVDPTFTAMPARPPLAELDYRGPVQGSVVPNPDVAPQAKPVPEGAPDGTPEDYVSPTTRPADLEAERPSL